MIFVTYFGPLQGCDAEEKYTAKMLSQKLDRQSLIGASPLSGIVTVTTYNLLIILRVTSDLENIENPGKS